MDERQAESQPSGDIEQRIGRSIAWTTLGAIGTNTVRILVIAFLGRLLVPEDFGLVAIALTVIVFTNTVRDLGVGSALVQHREPERRHVQTAFTVSVILGIAMAGAMVVGAPALAAIFRNDAAAPVVRSMAMVVAFRALATVPIQLARRRMRFGWLTAVDFVCYLIGSVISIALAWSGWGAWSLVVGYLVEGGLSTAAVLLGERVPPPLRVDWNAFRELFRFGGGQTLATIANVIATQGGTVIVGRDMGAAELGFYTRASELVQYPAVLFTNVVGSVLFPAFARLQDDPVRLAAAYRRALFANATLLMPASAGLVVVAPELITVLMGPGWEETVAPFRILAVSMFFRTCYKLGALVARARGDVYVVALAQAIYAFNVIVGGHIGTRWGIGGVSVAVTVAVIVHFALLHSWAARQVHVSLVEFARCHLSGVSAAIVVLAAVSVASAALRGAAAPGFAVVAVAVVAGLMALAASAVVGARCGDADWQWALGLARGVAKRLGWR